MTTKKSQYICIDFDGTICEYKYPEIGEAVDGAIEVIKELQDAGHKIILHTMRSGIRLDQAVEFCEENGITLYGINENKSQKHWTESPKIYGNFYIDDASICCPLVTPEKGKPYVDWEKVREMLVEKELLE